MMEAVYELGDRSTRLAVVHELMELAVARLTQRPNVDLALGAMAFVSSVPIDVN